MDDTRSLATDPPPVRPRGPSTASERALAPDLARGLMLLLIALANTPYYLWGRAHGVVAAHPFSGSATDGVVQAVLLVTVDLRTYPMFAFLFGYGIVQLVGRQQAAGTDERSVRRLLRRRHWWLLALGFAHAALLFEGDILGIYGLVGLVACWSFLGRRDVTLRVWACVLGGLMGAATVLAVVAAVLVHGSPGTETGSADLADSIANPDYLASVGERLSTWAVGVALVGLITLVIPVVVLLAFLAARRRVLEEPGRHLPLLRRAAVGGIAVGWLGGLPTALDQLRVVDVPDDVAWALFPVQSTTGLFAGVGYVAAFALLAHRLAARPAGPGRAALALQALGQRSLSGYLAQSVVCAPLLAAWGLGLGQHLSSWSMALLAVGVWLLTLGGAALLAARERRGPAEVVLRRLTYGRAVPGPVTTGGPRRAPGGSPDPVRPAP